MTPNPQKPEPAIKNHRGDFLDLHGMFFTLQGEGPFAGQRAVFIRLAGCNIQCPGCDTEYTAGRTTVSIQELRVKLQDILDEQEIENVLVVITGGEPFRQNLGPLIFDLLAMGHRIQVESNGILPPSAEVEMYLRQQGVTLVVSPKTSRIHEKCGRLAGAFKYVLRQGDIDPDDGLPTVALGHKATPRVARPPKWFAGTVYVNPMDEQNLRLNNANHQACAASAMMHGHTMGIQLHKILDLE